MNNNRDGYNMLSKRHLLAKSNAGINKYHCPVCNKNDFEVKPVDGKYSCWSGGCSTTEIRAAIDILEGNVFLPGFAKKPVSNWVKPIRPKSKKEYFYNDRNGNNLIKVLRIDPGNGDKKSFPQFHWNGFAWARGNPDEFKVNVPIYKYPEVRQAIADNTLVFVVEGESAADALWAIGIPATTTIGGAGKFTKYGNYTADFDGGKFVLAPDCDAVGIKHMVEFATLLGDKVHGYYLAGSNPDLWAEPCGAFDIGDDITDRHFDRDRILANIISADEYQKALKITPSKPVGRRRKQPTTPVDRDYQELARLLAIELPESGCDADGVPMSKLLKLELDILAIYGDRLEYNEMTCDIELDRKPIEMDGTRSFIAESNLGDKTQQDCDVAITRIAKLHRYSPVREYLESLRGKSQKEFACNIPQRYWGNIDPLQNLLFYKKLIACVARVFSPGCEDHTLLILKGGQGAGKSTALKRLSGEDWFTDDLRSMDDKDELAKLSKFWLLELAEVDYLFGKKETTLFKRFLSGCKDTFRPPYGRSNVTKLRTSALFATTNQSEFLSDPTGARRYWVVDVAQDIDVDRIKIDRDRIWAAALDAYESGIEWWLPKDLEIYHGQVNEQYQEQDIWSQLINSQIDRITSLQGSIEYTTINLVADRILNIDTDKQDKRVRNRVGAILRSNNFEAMNIRVEGEQRKVFGRSSLGRYSSTQQNQSSVAVEYHLKPLPPLINTNDTLVTHLYIDNKQDNKQDNENKIINNLSQTIENRSVTENLSNENPQTTDTSGFELDTQVLSKVAVSEGDRVWVGKYNENGTVSRIIRKDERNLSPAAIVILDSGKEIFLIIESDDWRRID
jgi:predicted P-loop ATPase